MSIFHVVNLVLPTQWCMDVFYCSFDSPTSLNVCLVQMKNQGIAVGEELVFLVLLSIFHLCPGLLAPRTLGAQLCRNMALLWDLEFNWILSLQTTFISCEKWSCNSPQCPGHSSWQTPVSRLAVARGTPSMMKAAPGPGLPWSGLPRQSHCSNFIVAASRLLHHCSHHPRLQGHHMCIVGPDPRRPDLT